MLLYMPEIVPDKIRLPSVAYPIELLNEDMITAHNNLIAKKEYLVDLNSQVATTTQEILGLQYQLMSLYVQTTGTFPGVTRPK